MIKITHKAGFTDGTREIRIKENEIIRVDKKGKEGPCRFDAEWLIQQAASQETDLCFEFVEEKPAASPRRSKRVA